MLFWSYIFYFLNHLIVPLTWFWFIDFRMHLISCISHMFFPLSKTLMNLQGMLQKVILNKAQEAGWCWFQLDKYYWSLVHYQLVIYQLCYFQFSIPREAACWYIGNHFNQHLKFLFPLSTACLHVFSFLFIMYKNVNFYLCI